MISRTFSDLRALIRENPTKKWVFYQNVSAIGATNFIKDKKIANRFWTGDWEKPHAKQVDYIAQWISEEGLLYVGIPSNEARIKKGNRWKIPFDNVKEYKVSDFDSKSTTLMSLLGDEIQDLANVCTYWPNAASELAKKKKTLDETVPQKKQTLSNATAEKLADDVDTSSSDESLKNEMRREIWCRTQAHAQFRKKLMTKWGEKCALTGMRGDSLLVASHIKPWAACRDEPKQQTDIDNGLLLCTPIDKLFDRGYLAFNDDGRIELHKKGHVRFLRETSLAVFGLNTAKLPKLKLPLTAKTKEFLKHHRDNVFNRD